MAHGTRQAILNIEASLDAISDQLELYGIGGSGQVTYDDDPVSYEDEVVIYV